MLLITQVIGWWTKESGFAFQGSEERLTIIWDPGIDRGVVRLGMVGMHHQITSLQLTRGGENEVDEDDLAARPYAAETNDAVQFSHIR